MTARLGGRTVRSLITSLEVLSDDEKQVLMLDRQEDGSIVIKTRAPHESAWSSNGPRFEVKAADARMLGSMLRSEDQNWNRTALEEIETADFTAPEPEEVIEKRLREKVGECSELDIERAKAANLAEQRKNIELEMERDHALNKHVGYRIDGCPACGRAIYPGHGDGSLHPAQPDAPTITRSDEEEAAFIALTTDAAAKRVGTIHEETPIGDRPYCGICGYVDEGTPDREYHPEFYFGKPADDVDELPF
jgi:hypothetical protein